MSCEQIRLGEDSDANLVVGNLPRIGGTVLAIGLIILIGRPFLGDKPL